LKIAKLKIAVYMPKILKGTVVSDIMQKTLVVEVVRLAKHPKYKRYYKISKRYKAHVEADGHHVGDKVMIQETRPLSKEKRWRVVESIKQARVDTL
jgi:small subunit ribosomal protein S17